MFVSNEGKPLDTQNTFNRHFKPLLERAGFPRGRVHDRRHSCISLLAHGLGSEAVG
jgi:integrase